MSNFFILRNASITLFARAGSAISFSRIRGTTCQSDKRIHSPLCRSSTPAHFPAPAQLSGIQNAHLQSDCPSATPLSACTASFPRDRPRNSGWVSMGVAHEAGILTSSPDGAIDHPARSPHRRRPATVLGKTPNDPADLGWIENDSDHRRPASAVGTGHDVQFVHLGKQPCPGFAAGARAEFLILQGIRGCWRRG